MNTNDVAVTVEAYFQGEQGAWTQSFQIAAHARTTREFTQLTGRTGFHSAEFYSNTPGREIQVSSTTLNNGFDGPFWSASQATNGSSEARTKWSFGEGGAFSWFDNKPVFDNWFVIYNPNPGQITVSGAFYADDIDPRPVLGTAAMPIAGRSRLAFKPFSTFGEGTAAQVRAANIHCSQPCVAQLVMRQRSGIAARQTNSQSALGAEASELKKTWYFVGVPTSANWHPRLYFFNAANAWNLMTLTYRDANGQQIGYSNQFWIPPESRHSYDVRLELAAYNPAALNRDGAISLQIDASQPMVVTKILYWPLGGHQWTEGASTTGHSAGGTRVIIPGGTVGAGGWSNYIQVMNVGSTATNVSVTSYREAGTGGPVVHNLGSIPAKGMRQLDASGYLGFQGNFATKLETDGGKIIAESSTYLHFTGGPLLWLTGDAVEGIVYDPASPYPIQP